MYEEFFHLSKAPFSMTPDPEFLFLASTHREALAGLMFTVLGRRGTAVLTGEVGTGKTTLLRKLIQSVPADKVQFCSIFSTNVPPAEFFELILIGFGLPVVGESQAQRLLRFWEFLMNCDEEGRTPVLLVDEAHKLSAELLEEVRLLMNFETAERKLLQVVLAGQNELRELMRREDLRQLRQRVSVRLDIVPLQPEEVERYMRHRWRQSGGNGNFPFDPEAVRLVANASRGIPRVMNAICDLALLRAYTSETAAIGAETIREALRALELPEPIPGLGERSPATEGLRLRHDAPRDIPLRKAAPPVTPHSPWWSSMFTAGRRRA
ncbi:MAG TPA: AAA family ATPase [Bryobacteraceae bacterium]|nr:AAA family ATPase [Bryobacteraceae bacterium]